MMWPARAVTKISAPGSSTFELYGLDFLIDSSYRWAGVATYWVEPGCLTRPASVFVATEVLKLGIKQGC
jgi:hypothetical protein